MDVLPLMFVVVVLLIECECECECDGGLFLVFVLSHPVPAQFPSSSPSHPIPSHPIHSLPIGTGEGLSVTSSIHRFSVGAVEDVVPVQNVRVEYDIDNDIHHVLEARLNLFVNLLQLEFPLGHEAANQIFPVIVYVEVCTLPIVVVAVTSCVEPMRAAPKGCCMNLSPLPRQIRSNLLVFVAVMFQPRRPQPLSALGQPSVLGWKSPRFGCMGHTPVLDGRCFRNAPSE